jgi:hypothetical protein
MSIEPSWQRIAPRKRGRRTPDERADLMDPLSRPHKIRDSAKAD